MNIVYLHSHDTGRFIQPYGYDVPTPALQSLAEDGVLFRNAFAASPTCSPSRAALLTGQYPHECGMLGLAHRGWKLADYRRHLAPTLSRAGYTSALAGFQHVAHPGTIHPREIGYDVLLNHDDAGIYNEPRVTDAAVDFLEQHHDRPFFLDAGYFETHRDFDDPNHAFTKRGHPPVDARYVRPPPMLPDLPEIRQDWANFREAAAIFDRNVGRILETIDRRGLRDETLVVVTTDHGLPLPMCKATLSDGGLGVMLLLRGPSDSGFAGGRVADTLVSHIDLYPTLFRVAQTTPPAGHHGFDLHALLNDNAPPRQWIFGEMNEHSRPARQRCVRSARYKFVRLFPDSPEQLKDWPWQCDDGPTASVLDEAGMGDRVPDIEQFYDLHLDPLEQRNLVADSKLREMLHVHRNQLYNWMQETDDPLHMQNNK